VYFIDAGEFIEGGPANEILDRPRDDRTRSFLARLLRKT
jgi:ABC-type polar amino acid transport system ATPase subunit